MSPKVFGSRLPRIKHLVDYASAESALCYGWIDGQKAAMMTILRKIYPADRKANGQK
jgi:hypothetical protein